MADLMWSAISSVGDAALTFPVAIACATWLTLSDRRLAWRWVMLLAAGSALVGATKILYFGCGIEIRPIDFRVISGHTALSTSVWTVTFALLYRSAGGNVMFGAATGLVIGALTAVARVLDNAHTPSEVVAGWLLGAAIALLFVHALKRSSARIVLSSVGACVLALIVGVAYGHHAPIQDMIEDYSPGVCAGLLDAIAMRP
ncbi:PAP2 superfamily protein [Paraburkholderia caballeronis]|nr:PAP2 superfamily protein [Paraburkholderia caballeronis]TDV17533.1 PAP2 superfamily protein [Paraburkholderia caballeronis]TDV27551.1 PAP2 superfamily protein [Paraburkholderia caballeronis]TDV36288.1 PAP2 superfamily protein [Paraburkholderia caballeronis]